MARRKGDGGDVLLALWNTNTNCRCYRLVEEGNLSWLLICWLASKGEKETVHKSDEECFEQEGRR